MRLRAPAISYVPSFTSSLSAVAVMLLASCTAAPAPAPDPTLAMSSAPAEGDDLPLGDKPADDKADGTWGDALNCKPIPELPQLVAPQITVSLQGLTLHLVDTATGYDKVFPIGPGQIESDETEPSFGESKSYYPIIGSGRQDFSLSPRTVNACRTMWTDPETKEQSPVFAGLPFMPFFGAYAIHGPIDGYRAKNGGSLRRGFVSHGCIRMEAADVSEVYARIKTLAKVPVHLQREPERLVSGARVDLASRWIGAECSTDGDCNYAGGACHANAYGGRGFCTASCTRGCADRAGAGETFCVADPSDSTKGMCVNKVVAQNPDCRQFGQMKAQTRMRINQANLSAAVCLPGSRGSIGDPCYADGECRNGASCAGASPNLAGACSESCVTACPDEPGFPMTACANDPVPGSGLARGCARACTVESNATECEGGTTCVRRDATSSKDRRMICKRKP